MAEDRREELLRRAVETSLIGSDDNQTDEVILADDAPSLAVKSPSVDPQLEPSFADLPGARTASAYNSSSIEDMPKAEENLFITEERPQAMLEKNLKVESDPFPPQQSSPVGTVSKKQVVAYRPEGPIGIDIGTTSIVLAEGRGKSVYSIKQTNFSTSFPLGSYTKNVLFEHEVPYFQLSNFEYLQGYATETISNTFHGDPLWQYSKDSEQEQEGLCLIEGILQNIISRPKIPAVPLYFSVPGESLEGGNSLLYQTGIIQSFLAGLGYSARPINEGLAVVMAELADNNFTGIGVSIGGGMCNICLAYLSIPVLSFSIQKAGDYIDKQVSVCTGELLYNVKAAKEKTFSLLEKPTNQVERALKIYYDDMVQAVVSSMKSRFRKVDLPIYGPIPLVFSGGVMKTKGLIEAFEKALGNTKLPVEFSQIQQATDPLTSVAKGALVKAMFEEF